MVQIEKTKVYTLTDPEIGIINAALGKLAMETSLPLFIKIKNQFESQTEEIKPVEKKTKESER